ncbi:MAG: type II toxin-antitoxin system RelE/ParE family toxin [Gemmatimonadaceae bacterium]
MIKSFRDKRTEELFTSGWARGVPPDLAWRAIKKLTAIDRATSVQTLRYPAGNRLHALTGDRDGQFSIAVNRQWRICFHFVDGHAYDVELCDYH